MNLPQLAENYLETLQVIRNVWAVDGDLRHLEVSRKDQYQTMLIATGKTAQDCPNGMQLAYDILDGKIQEASC